MSTPTKKNTRGIVIIFMTLMLIFSTGICLAQYNDFKKNPDGTYVLGGCYAGWQKNPDGTFVVGGGNTNHGVKVAILSF